MARPEKTAIERKSTKKGLANDCFSQTNIRFEMLGSVSDGDTLWSGIVLFAHCPLSIIGFDF